MSNTNKQFKLHWGNALALSFILFGIFIGVLVVGTIRENIDMIEDNYYEAEVQYQGRMEEMQRVENLPSPPTMLQQNNQLVIYIPGEDIREAKAVFKRPDNAKFDFETPLEAGETILEDNAVLRGSWIVELSWMQDGLRYFKKLTHYQN